MSLIYWLLIIAVVVAAVVVVLMLKKKKGGPVMNKPSQPASSPEPPRPSQTQM